MRHDKFEHVYVLKQHVWSACKRENLEYLIHLNSDPDRSWQCMSYFGCLVPWVMVAIYDDEIGWQWWWGWWWWWWWWWWAPFFCFLTLIFSFYFCSPMVFPLSVPCYIRYTAEQALQDTWIKDRAPKAENISLQDRIVHNLRSFRPGLDSWASLAIWTLPMDTHG